MSNEKMREALVAARAGLVWYIESYPQAANGCDDEMLEQIDSALAQQSEPVLVQGCNRSHPHENMQDTCFDTWEKTMNDHIKSEPAQVSQEPVASVIKGGADRHFMSENMRSLPDGLHQLYAEPPDYEALKADLAQKIEGIRLVQKVRDLYSAECVKLKLRVAELEGIAIRTDAVITEATENVIQIIAERDKLQSNLTALVNICANTGVNRQIREVIGEMEQAK